MKVNKERISIKGELPTQQLSECKINQKVENNTRRVNNNSGIKSIKKKARFARSSLFGRLKTWGFSVDYTYLEVCLYFTLPINYSATLFPGEIHV